MSNKKLNAVWGSPQRINKVFLKGRKKRKVVSFPEKMYKQTVSKELERNPIMNCHVIPLQGVQIVVITSVGLLCVNRNTCTLWEFRIV